MLAKQTVRASIDYNVDVTTLRRRLFTGASVLSLILCLATVGLWVRSYWTRDSWGRFSNGICGCQFATNSGRLQWAWDTMMPTRGWLHSAEPASTTDDPWFAVHHYDFRPRAESWFVFVPIALPAILFAVAPVWWLLGRRRTMRRRRKLGVCDRCGYDLRATPNKCPECGRLASPQAWPGSIQ